MPALSAEAVGLRGASSKPIVAMTAFVVVSITETVSEYEFDT